MSVTTKARFLIFALLASITLSVAARPIEAQQTAPDFQAVDLEQRPIQLSSLKGCGVMLYFFSSWCSICHYQTPAIVEAHKRLRKQGVIFLGINVMDSEEGARAVVAKEGITFPVVIDHDEVIKALYRNKGVPQTVLISPRGTISQDFHGWSSRIDFTRLARSVAGGKNCKVKVNQLP